jgi:hypothetical protein
VTATVGAIEDNLGTRLSYHRHTAGLTGRRSLRVTQPLSLLPTHLHEHVAFISLNSPINTIKPLTHSSSSSKREIFNRRRTSATSAAASSSSSPPAAHAVLNNDHSVWDMEALAINPRFSGITDRDMDYLLTFSAHGHEAARRWLEVDAVAGRSESGDTEAEAHAWAEMGGVSGESAGEGVMNKWTGSRQSSDRRKRRRRLSVGISVAEASGLHIQTSSGNGNSSAGATLTGSGGIGNNSSLPAIPLNPASSETPSTTGTLVNGTVYRVHVFEGNTEAMIRFKPVCVINNKTVVSSACNFVVFVTSHKVTIPLLSFAQSILSYKQSFPSPYSYVNTHTHTYTLTTSATMCPKARFASRARASVQK